MDKKCSGRDVEIGILISEEKKKNFFSLNDNNGKY